MSGEPQAPEDRGGGRAETTQVCPQQQLPLGLRNLTTVPPGAGSRICEQFQGRNRSGPLLSVLLLKGHSLKTCKLRLRAC